MSQHILSDFAEKAYLDYAMYVILDRALPSVCDGLKPVQRRILYAMSELGLSATSKPKKSARTVGDVIGKFHPHGDSACYEAMVHMAQWFSYRYPLIDGQGNWGAPDDPKSFAAMRYTESRLSAYAKNLLQELADNTVDWAPNFDGSLEEPELLPARLPNMLLNGATGIAVGMSTDIPPHHLNEVVEACIQLLDSPKTSLKDILKIIKGPDFPTGGHMIASDEELLEMYQSGRGTFRVRAEYKVVKDRIEVMALPYQTSVNKIYEQIAEQMKAKKLPMLLDMRDESDQDAPVRLVMFLRSNRVDAEAVMQHLFATTDLEKSIRFNMNAIALDGRPKVFNLCEVILEWLTFRKDTVTRRLNHRLDQVTDRLHILDGLLVAYLNIDEVIHIIRTADEPKPKLMKQFKLTGTQAEAILNLRLRRLGKLEEIEIRSEQGELQTEQAELEQILGSKTRLKTLIKKELKADAKLYGNNNPRRTTRISAMLPAKALSVTDVMPKEPITVVLSQQGWARVAKGHEADPTQLKYKSGDGFLHAATGYSNQVVLGLATHGKSFMAMAHELPSARGFGEPFSSRFNVPDGVQFSGVIMGEDSQSVVVAGDTGYGFVTTVEAMQTKQKAGRQVLGLPKGGQALAPCLVPEGGHWIAVLSSDGRLLTYPLDELPEQAKGRGVKLMQLPKGSSDVRMVSVAVLTDEDSLVVHTEKRSMTLDVEALEAYEGARARRGLVLPRGWRTVVRIEALSPEV